ncbi:MAG: hypothetical protein AAF226_15595 [Verrucomicrobiota bacterium]
MSSIFSELAISGKVIALLVGGGVMTFIGVFWIGLRWLKVMRYSRAEGVFVKWKFGTSGTSKVRSPIYLFDAGDKTYEVSGLASSYRSSQRDEPPKLAKVTVHFDPSDPEKAVIYSFIDLCLAPIIIVGFGLVILLGGLGEMGLIPAKVSSLPVVVLMVVILVARRK